MNALEVFGSFKEASELTKEPHTGCTLTRTERHVALSPKYIGRLRTGVGEILDAELGRFSESLRGVLLAYNNVKLLQSTGLIVDDNPFIHFDVVFDAVVFNPKPTSLLKCVVTEQASDHVGCLVLDWFNVSLLASSGQKQPRLEPGYVILVQVERLRSLNGMLAIEARAPDDGSALILEAVSLQCKDTDGESNVDSLLQSSPSDIPDVTGISSGAPGNKPSSGKKNKKKHAKTELLEIDSLQSSVWDSIDGSGIPEMTFGAEAKSQKKKKRKHADSEQELDVDSLQTSLLSSQDVSGQSKRTSGKETSTKMKKKRSNMKQELGVDSLQPSLCLITQHGETQTGIETSKPKKSKKHKQLETAEETDDKGKCDAADLTAGEQTSPNKKMKKKLKHAASDPGPESLKNHSEETTGEKTNSTKKKKKKERKIPTGVDLYQPLLFPNGPTSISPENQLETRPQESHDEDIVYNLLPFFNEQSPTKKHFTELKKRKDKRIHKAVDSFLKPLSTDSSLAEQTAHKKHKKKK